MHFTVVKDGKEYMVTHMSNSMYTLDDKQYGPESYLIRGPEDQYSRAMTVKEFKDWEKDTK